MLYRFDTKPDRDLRDRRTYGHFATAYRGYQPVKTKVRQSKGPPRQKISACSSTFPPLLAFYRAMHFSAKRGLAIACRLSLRPSLTLVDCDHICWNSPEI